MAVAVYVQSTDIVLVFLLLRQGVVVIPAATKLGLYPCDHLQRIERLGYIIVCANGEAHYLVAGFYLCCQHYHRIKVFFPYLPADVKAVNIRQHDVQNRKVGFAGFKVFQSVRAVVEFPDSVAIVCEVDLNKVGDLFFIVYYEYCSVHFVTSSN